MKETSEELKEQSAVKQNEIITEEKKTEEKLGKNVLKEEAQPLSLAKESEKSRGKALAGMRGNVAHELGGLEKLGDAKKKREAAAPAGVPVQKKEEQADPLSYEALAAEADKAWDARYRTSKDFEVPYKEKPKAAKDVQNGILQTSDILFCIPEAKLDQVDQNGLRFFDSFLQEKVSVEADVKQMNDQMLRDMWKGRIPGKPDGYVPELTELQEIRTAFVSEALKKAGLKKEDLEKTYIDGEDSGATVMFLRQIGAWEIYHLLDTTKLYRQYREQKQEYMGKALEAVPRAEIKGSSVLKVKEFSYETQGKQNCYACSLAGIYNHFVSADPELKEQELPKLDQEKIRSFVPRFLTTEELKKVNPNGGEDLAEQQRNGVLEYAGAGKQRSGHLVGISDVLFESRKNGGAGLRDVAVYEKTYGLNRVRKGNETMRKNMIEAMKKQIHEVIDSGQMVSLLSNGHYVTVIGIKDNRIRYLESSSSTPTEPREEDFDEYLKCGGRGYSAVELSYLKKITPQDREQLQQEFPGMGVDEKTGEVIRKNDIFKDHDIAHREGIVIAKSNDEIFREGNGDIARLISESVCLSRAAFMNAKQRKAFDKKNNEGWEASQKEWDEHNERLAAEKEHRQEEERLKQEEEKKAEERVKEILAKQLLEREMLKKREEAIAQVFSVKEKKEFEKQHDAFLAKHCRNTYKKELSPEAKAGYLKLLRVMKEFDKTLSDDALNTLAGDIMALENNDVSEERQMAGIHALEKLFINILEFDPDALEVDGVYSMAEKMNAYAALMDLAEDQDNILFKIYREIRAVHSADTAINLAGTEEIRKHLDVIRAYGDHYRTELDIYKNDHDTHIQAAMEGRSAEQMTREQIEAELSKPLPAELLNYYSKGLTLKYTESALSEAREKDVSENAKEKLLGNLRQRERDYTEREELKKKAKEAEKSYERKRDARDERMRAVLSSAGGKTDEKTGRLAFLCTAINGDDDAVALQLCRVLKEGVPGANATAKKKQQFIDALEQAFRAVADFDAALFRAESGADFYASPKKYEACRDMVELSKALAAYLPAYGALIGKAGVSTALDAERFAEVQNRIALFSEGDALLKAYGKTESLPDTGKYLLKEDAAQQLREAFVRKREETYRNEGTQAEAALKTTAADYTNSGSLRMVQRKTLTDYAAEHKLREGLSVTERERKMKNPRSALYKKVSQADALAAESKAVRGEMAKRRRSLAFNVRSLLSEEEFKAASAFFGGDAEQNAALVRSLAQNRNAAMDGITKQFLSLKLEKIDLSTDDAMIACAGELEELTQKLSAFRTFYDGAAEYKERLGGMQNGDGTVLAAVEEQIRELSAVTEYYRVRKLLITDPYYTSHYKDELSVIHKDSDPKEAREVSRLMMFSLECAKRLKTVFGIRAAGEELPQQELAGQIQGKKGHSAAEAYLHEIAAVQNMDTYIRSLEEGQRSKAYRDGRVDLTQCSAQKLDAMLKEIEELKKNGQLEMRDIQRNTPAFRKAEKKLSPMTKQFFRYLYYNSFGQPEHAKEHYNSLYRRLKGKEVKNDRLKKRDNDLEFRNSFTNESFTIGEDMNRVLENFCRMGESEGMSEEEIVELFEDMNMAGLKDLDLSDEKQAEAATERYLKSIARFYRMNYEQHMRFINTYGLLPDQLPPYMLAAAMPESFSELRLRMNGAAMENYSKLGWLKTADGKKQKLIDLLAERGYLSREFCDDFIRLSDHNAGTNFILSESVTSAGLYVQNGGISKKLEPDVPQSFVDSVNVHRKDYDGMDIPRLSNREEREMWKELRGATALSGQSFREIEEGSIRQRDKEAAEVKALNGLERYIEALSGVDSSGHSAKYNTMHEKLLQLTGSIRSLAGRHAADGKNVSPADLIGLRRLYGEAFRASGSYLKDKNRQHKNALYRRRYDIVEELMQTLEKDYNGLMGKMADRSYPLTELLTESRQEIISVNAGDVTKHSGSLNVRNAFTRSVNGVEKKMAFTKRTVLRSGKPSAEPFEGFRNGTKEYPAFPELAWICTNMGREALDAFFKRPGIASYLEDLRRKRIHEWDLQKERDKFEKSLEAFLGELWDAKKQQLTKENYHMFPARAGNVILGRYKGFSSAKRRQFTDRLIEIGKDLIRELAVVQTHARGGIAPGANLDKRNVAVSILSKEIGTNESIAYSELASVEIREEGKKQKAEEGILMEWVGGYNIDQVEEGLKKGEIECDNEAELIEQLSDIQVTDYLAANLDRHMGNIMMRMEETGRYTKDNKPILRIRQIVGIDNDMSCGSLRAGDIGDYIQRLTPPEQMQIISRRTADRILLLTKEQLFLTLGSTITETEKECMWSRVEYMKLAIQKAGSEGNSGNLRILKEEDFRKISLKDLARANSNADNIYKAFSYYVPQSVRERDEQPHRYACEEQRIDLNLNSTVSVKGKVYAADPGHKLMLEFLGKNSKKRREMTADPNKHMELFELISGANASFNRTVGALFSKLSDNRDYGRVVPANESCDCFSNEYAKSRGINSILDLFYIDGKPAAELMPEDIAALPQTLLSRLTDTYGPRSVSAEGLRDMVSKAFIMAYLSSGEHQITLATYQTAADGTEETVITDLNVYAGRSGNLSPAEDIKCTDVRGNSALIMKSRKNRAARFEAIRRKMQERAGE